MRIAGLFAPGGALLLAAALFAGGAAAAEDDLPDLGEEVERMASEVALELQRVCPPAAPADQAAFDRCRRSLFADSALRRSLAPRLLWGRRHQDAGAALKHTNLTQFAPDVFVGLYVSLFMFSRESRCSTVCSARTTLTCRSSSSPTGPWRCGCATRNAKTATCPTTPCRCAGC